MPLSSLTAIVLGRYAKRNVPTDDKVPDSFRQYLSDEFQEIENNLQANSDANLQVADVEPEKPRKGMMRYAVSPWDPLNNGTQGLVVYNGTAWEAVQGSSGGSGGGGSSPEVNDLTTSVTWANVPDANITESSVTQHQGALSITESQISDLQSYLTSEANDLSTTVTWSDVPDANITESSVTQHQAALSITESQISDLQSYLTSHQDISGKANLSGGATFYGDVSIGTLPSNVHNMAVSGVANLYGGANVTGNMSVTGTVDGRNVSVDGTRLDSLKYNKTNLLLIRDSSTKSLTNAYTDLGSYKYIYDTETPVKTMRFLDISPRITWGYTSSTNDLQMRITTIVPSGGGTVYNLGSATQVNSSDYPTLSYYEKWFYVSGDKTHLFTEFGKVHENSNGGTYEKSIYSWQYNPGLDRTYFLMSTYPTVPATGTTLYWHPYAWEAAGTSLIEYKDIDERYMSGNRQTNLMVKTAYDDAALTYRIEIREMSTTDSASVQQTYLKITQQEP